MKKSLQNKLKSYSALAGSLALISTQADAQIVYTDVTPDSTSTTDGATYDLDVDNNGMVDFTISMVQSASSSYIKNAIYASPAVSNGIAGSTGASGAYEYPTAMNAGDSVKASLAFNVNTGQSMLYFGQYGSSSGVYGNWASATDKYLGLKFMIGTQVHYGWARLNVNANATSFTIKDYAYEATPNTGIEAGEMPSSSAGINELLAHNTMIFGFGKSIKVKLSNTTIDGTITVVDILGQELANVAVTDETTIISMENAKSGVYFANIKKADGSSYTKKLFLK